MKTLRTRLAALASALLMAACGGGGSDTTPATKITSVKVFGDSLADSGTFRTPAGVKIRFTVQGAATQIYPERIAAAYGLPAMCPFFLFDGTTFVANTLETGCTNFAIGASRINSIDPTIPAVSPQRVGTQLALASGTVGFSATDLLVIDGGGNDAADVVTAFLTLQAAPTAGNLAAYHDLAASVLDVGAPGTTNAILGGTNGTAVLGGAYLTALAQNFYNSIKTSALDHGAVHIALINMPGITKTPRLRAALAQVAATAGATAAAQAEGLFDSWIQAFNTKLASLVAGDKRIVLIDLYSAFNDEVDHPAQFSLDNVTDPLCALSAGLAEFAVCTDAALTAQTPPAGFSGPNWWRAHLFSDGFHPSPYGHQLFFQRVSLDLARAGLL
jgi:phospholipase/lecithinase/hemolysin